MAMLIYPSFITFIIALVVSAIVIYAATKILGETEGFGTAIVAALIGAIIYALAFFFLGGGTIAAIIGGIAWLIALGSLYNMGWIKSFIVAIVIWVLAMLVSYALPTVVGPL